MAATNFTPISLYYSTTAAAVPVNTNLVNGELAINITDGKLFYKDNSGVVQVLATKSGTSGVFSSITNTGLTSGRVVYSTTGGLETDSANLLFNGTTLTANTLNLTNALGTTYGGTGLTSFTANGVVYASSSSVLATGSALTFDGTNLSVGTTALSGGKFSTLADLTAVNGLVVRDSATTYANNDNYVLLQNSTGVTVGGFTHPAANSLGVWGNDDIRFFQSGAATELMRLTSTGLGIGTSSPTGRATVTTNGSGGVNVNESTNATSTYGYLTLSHYTNGAFISTVAGSNAAADVVRFGTSNTERMRLDSSGNLGLGVTPSAWTTAFKAFQVGATGSLVYNGNTDVYLSNNYASIGGSSKYITTAAATLYQQGAGVHAWYNAPSGTAGNAISFTQAMTLDASGKLAIGTTSTPIGFLGVRLGSSSGTVAQFNTLNASSGNTAIQIGGYDFASSTSGAYLRVYHNHGSTTNSQLAFEVNGTTEAARIDSSGNLGLGVTPSAWSQGRAMELINPGYGIWNGSGSPASMYMLANAYFNGNFKYGGTGQASHYYQYQGAHVWSTAASGTAGNAITFTQAMTLFPSGGLAIGATGDPAAGSLVLDGNSGRFTFSAGSTANQILSTTTGFGAYNILRHQASSYEWLNAASTQMMTLDASGNLLVGKTSTSGTSGVGTFIASDGRINVVNAASTNAFTTYELYSTGAGAYRFYVGSAGTIFATSVVISAISDQRLKENVRDIDTGIDAIMALKPRRFDWKEGKGQDKKDVAGFVAQEFETVFPECVSTSKAGEDGIEYKNINHETLIPTLVKAIQEQQAMIEDLKTRLAAAGI